MLWFLYSTLLYSTLHNAVFKLLLFCLPSYHSPLLLCSYFATSTQKREAGLLRFGCKHPRAIGFPISWQWGLPVAARWPLPACYLRGTWCSRYVSLLVSTTASSKLPVLGGSCLVSCFSSLAFSFSLHNSAHKGPATLSAVQTGKNHTVCVRNSHIRRFSVIWFGIYSSCFLPGNLFCHQGDRHPPATFCF